MTTAADVIAIAKAEVGTVEKPVNRTKYGEAFGWNGVSWCAIFVWWARTQAGMDPLKTASCGMLVQDYKRRGRFSNRPHVGDDFFCGPGGGSHTGIVTSVSASGLSFGTIEGNSNTDGSYNGTSVVKRRRQVGDGRTYGFGVPDYSPIPQAQFLEEDDMIPYSDKFIWPDGSAVQVYLDGSVKCFGAKFFGSMHDMAPEHSRTFTKAVNVRPVVITGGLGTPFAGGPQDGYIVGTENGDEWRFDANVQRFFKKN